jgi:hypothetical protein
MDIARDLAMRVQREGLPLLWNDRPRVAFGELCVLAVDESLRDDGRPAAWIVETKDLEASMSALPEWARSSALESVRAHLDARPGGALLIASFAQDHGALAIYGHLVGVPHDQGAPS